MIEIPLTQGYTARISDHRAEEVAARKWFAAKIHGSVYAVTREKNRNLYMHQFLMKPAPGFEVDHKDGDTLNYQDDNLRVCTHLENMRNRKRYKNNTSGYKGVYITASGKPYAMIRDKKLLYLGLHDTPEAAARSYDAKALELFGEFARLNFPTPQLPPADAWSFTQQEPKPGA